MKGSKLTFFEDTGLFQFPERRITCVHEMEIKTCGGSALGINKEELSNIQEVYTVWFVQPNMNVDRLDCRINDCASNVDIISYVIAGHKYVTVVAD